MRRAPFSTRERIEIPTLADAACSDAGVDPEIFFPHTKDPLTLLMAREVCGRCMARYACLSYALNQPEEPYGIWGGKTREERAAMRREMGRW